MNLSCAKPFVSNAGNMTREITCYTCGMPSSKDWAQKVRSRPSTPLRPYYPFLLNTSQPANATMKEDGSTFVCAFCHASLEAQWKNYERQPNPIPPNNRKYNLYKFICACCGVETYRKRVRTLPFQEFPFLANNQRPPGSLTLGNNPLAVVCLDCSETLWAQSAEYDRWGLPVSKRHFNWMARPPPPEDSVEATVARLPSGETQLPRCPPEPIIIKTKEISVYEAPTLVTKSKSRNSKSESIAIDSNVPDQPVRKTSLTHFDTAHPPVVTVAPMSSTHTTISSLRKETLSVPPNLSSGYPKYDSLSSVGLPQPPLYPRSSMFPPELRVWNPSSLWAAGREGALNDSYSYPSVDAIQNSTANSWPWLPPPAPTSNLIQYQTYIPTSFSNRSYSLSEPFYNSYYQPPSPEVNSTTPASSIAPTSSPYAVTFSSGSSSPTYVPSSFPSSTITHPRNSISSVNEHQEPSSSHHHSVRKLSSDSLKNVPSHMNSSQTAYQDVARKSSCGKSCSSAVSNRGTLSKKSATATATTNTTTTSSTTTTKRDSNAAISSNTNGPSFKSTLSGSSLPTNFKPKANAIRNHEKLLLNSSQWKSSINTSSNSSISTTRTVTPPSSASTTTAGAESNKSNGNQILQPVNKKLEIAVPKKQWQWQSQKNGKINSLNNKHRVRTTSDNEPMDFSSMGESSNGYRPPENNISKEKGLNNCREDEKDTLISSRNDSSAVMDLSSSIKIPDKPHQSNQTSSKFMIAYLCQSECNQNEMKDRHCCSSVQGTIENSESFPETLKNGQETSTSATATIDNGSLKTSGRSSVIVTLPKTDTVDTSNSHMEDERETFDDKSSNNEKLKVTRDSNDDTCKLENDIVSSPDDESSGNSTIDANYQSSTSNYKTNSFTATEESSSRKVNETESETKEEKDIQTLPYESSGERSRVTDNPPNGIINGDNVIGRDDLNLNQNKLQNVQSIVRKIIGEYKMELRNTKLRKRKLEEDQEEFLAALGLITPKKKLDIELENLISRSEHQTLPILKFRVPSPPKLQLSEEFEKKLLQIAFDDPSMSLRKSDLNQEEVEFLAQLDLKPASRHEKTLREKKWRYVLTEKMMREKRGKHLRGTKKIWETYNGTSKFALTKPRANSSSSQKSSDIFGSLSLTLPVESDTHKCSNSEVGPSDLLSIVDSQSTFNKIANITTTTTTRGSNESITVSALCTVISYPQLSIPKYIPSYAAQASVPSVPAEDSCLEVSNSGPSSSRQSPNNDKTEIHQNLPGVNILNDDSQQCTESDEIQQHSVDNGLLRVPVISDTTGTIIKEEKEANIDTLVQPTIDSIIAEDKLNCANFELQINNLLDSISTKDANLKIDDWKILKKYLYSRQQHGKSIEDRLKKKEKQILKALRGTSNTKNTQ